MAMTSFTCDIVCEFGVITLFVKLMGVSLWCTSMAPKVRYLQSSTDRQKIQTTAIAPCRKVDDSIRKTMEIIKKIKVGNKLCGLHEITSLFQLLTPIQ